MYLLSRNMDEGLVKDLKTMNIEACSTPTDVDAVCQPVPKRKRTKQRLVPAPAWHKTVLFITNSNCCINSLVLHVYPPIANTILLSYN